jgi:ABC-type oligopeptide transport system substrate-binding subunit
MKMRFKKITFLLGLLLLSCHLMSCVERSSKAPQKEEYQGGGFGGDGGHIHEPEE